MIGPTSESTPHPFSPPPAASTRKEHAVELFSGLPRHYDLAGAALSFGQDPRWRRALVDVVRARAGERVLDVATGTGMVASELVRRYGVNVVALDQSPEMLAGAKARLGTSPQLAAHVTLLEGEAERLPFTDGEFDHLTFTYLLRYVDDAATTLRELARVVAPGGRIAMLEFAEPSREPWRAMWGIYTRFGLPTLGRLISREWSEAGRFLSRSIPAFYACHPLATLPQLWREAGIDDVQMRVMSFGAGIVMWGVRDSGDSGPV
ncbi:MAG TPA: ubiquinone/menaquinone biosynthesis methyltransferase [Solirubrobacteraceae bacterium]|jgi:demethylmenaquinone methyltransferase/2-methoxy-6-polyprenyl-1,4-benzoquinol methylase